jgi:hypothetical protein
MGWECRLLPSSPHLPNAAAQLVSNRPKQIRRCGLQAAQRIQDPDPDPQNQTPRHNLDHQTQAPDPHPDEELEAFARSSSWGWSLGSRMQFMLEAVARSRAQHTHSLCNCGKPGWRGCSAASSIALDERGRPLQESYEAFARADRTMPYWARRCGRDCTSKQRFGHIHFDCKAKAEEVESLVQARTWPEGIPERSLPHWLQWCAGCKRARTEACFDRSDAARGDHHGRIRCFMRSSFSHPDLCIDCAYPMCTVCTAVSERRMTEADLWRQYQCDHCRHPDCAGCGREPRPRRPEYVRARIASWYCDAPACQELALPTRTSKRTRCGGEKPLTEFTKWETRRGDKCDQCKFPTCLQCGEIAAAPVPSDRREKDESYLCDPCRYPPCSGCGRRKRPRRLAYTVKNMPSWFCDYKTCQSKKRKAP